MASSKLLFGLGFALLLSYLGGIVYLFLLPYQPLLAQGIYIDENALLPGVGRSKITRKHVNIALELDANLQKSLLAVPIAERATVMSTFIERELDTFGSLAHRFPRNFDTVDRTIASTITYGKVQPKKGDGKQCVVFVIEYDLSLELLEESVGVSGVSMMLALAQYFKTIDWLSPDIVLVFVDATPSREAGIAVFRDWVQAYHGADATGAEITRSGMILAGIALDFPFNQYSNEVSLVAASSSGLLANLDLPSLVGKLAMSMGVPVGWSESPATDILSDENHEYDELKDVKPLFRFMRDSILGPDFAYHSELVAVNVDALSLQAYITESNLDVIHEATPGKKKKSQGVFVSRYMKILEVTTRSLSNMIEKLHHSTCLYMLTGHNAKQFVTMSKYSYSFVLVGVPLPISAFYLLFSRKTAHNFGAALAVVVMLATVCIASYVASTVTTEQVGWTDDTALYWAAGSIGVSLVLLFGFLPRILAIAGGHSDKSNLTQFGSIVFDWKTVKAIAMLVTTVSFAPMAIFNYSLGLLVLLFIVPVIVPVVPLHEAGILRKLVVLVLFGAFSPVGLSLAVFGAKFTAGPLDLITVAVKHLPSKSTYLYSAVFVFYVPLLLLAFIIAFSRPIREGGKQQTKKLKAD